jgi:hypothetical protein
MTIAADIQAAILQVPAGAWTPAYDGGGQVREATWVADITGLAAGPGRGPHQVRQGDRAAKPAAQELRQHRANATVVRLVAHHRFLWSLVSA